MPERPAPRFLAGRHAGVLVPLFSIPSRWSWGIGEIPDLARLARWVEKAGMDFVQILPVNEMQEGQNSPYSALSAMAIDPIFISPADLEDFAAFGGESALPEEDRRHLDQARASSNVDHDAVRSVKLRALRAAFDTFEAAEGADSARARQFHRFVEREASWLDDYALFRALHEEQGGRYWIEWRRTLRDRAPAALAAANRRLARQIRYFKYLQWIADEQWQSMRREAAPCGIFGDFPFMVSGHSADVWARQDEFRLDASVGVPPDAFSETGQDWGLPVYRWDVIAGRGYQWLRDRTRRCAELYDGFRVDHLVGFYRTFVRERDDTTYFVPPDEANQREQGEVLLHLFGSLGSRIIAEDLGTVPDFVRESMAGLAVPGMQVLRWEREWDAESQRFRDPAVYPATGVAVSGTHDTETLAEWWDAAEPLDRRLFLQLPALRNAGVGASDPYSERLRDAILDMLFGARSDFVIVAMQDIFGWRDRINTPASTHNENWKWRLPLPVEDLVNRPEPQERSAFLHSLSARHRRSLPVLR